VTKDRVRTIALDFVRATPATVWAFLALQTEAGFFGLGEATLVGEEAALAAGFPVLRSLALALPHAAPEALPADRPLQNLAEAALHSALDQALWDLAARRAGVALATALGGARRGRVPLYANINRRTRDRSPEGFAASARAARKIGFRAFKIAPFDEVTVEARQAGGALAAAAAGLTRIAAVRAAIGPEAELLVDCHWRFDEEAARVVLAECAARGVAWFECPLPETEETIPAIVGLRGLAHRHGMRLAGGEKLIRLAAFAPFIDAGAYDVMMPDIKYVGGLAEMLRLAERMAAAGIAFSPHNPSGPVAYAASLQLCAAAPALDRLELQWDESFLFSALAAPPLPEPSGGAVAVPLDRPGIGIALDRTLMTRHAPGRQPSRRS
jgi:galactonate dehydratase